MAKFKVGDKVKLIGDSNSAKGKANYFGKIATINRDDGCGGYCYTLKEGYGTYCWRDSELELVVETPREFKVGDRVKVNEKAYSNWENLKEKGVDLGTVIAYNNKDSIGIEFDKNFGGHNCGKNDCKYGHGWWLNDREIELVEEEPKEEPKAEPIPTPVVNVNVTVNLYENACWYCRKGGLVDLYLAGAMGICPSCGRVCNNIVPTKPKKESIVIEFKPKEPKENKPLTTEELKALPNGTRVFTVWLDRPTKEPLKTDDRTCWRTKYQGGLKRKSGDCGFATNGVYYHAYLEMPDGFVDNDP